MKKNDLEDKFKKFWLDRSKEEIIEAYFDSIKNCEVLLNIIKEVREYIEKEKVLPLGEQVDKLLEILDKVGSEKE